MIVINFEATFNYFFKSVAKHMCGTPAVNNLAQNCWNTASWLPGTQYTRGYHKCLFPFPRLYEGYADTDFSWDKLDKLITNIVCNLLFHWIPAIHNTKWDMQFERQLLHLTWWGPLCNIMWWVKLTLGVPAKFRRWSTSICSHIKAL